MHEQTNTWFIRPKKELDYISYIYISIEMLALYICIFIFG